MKIGLEKEFFLLKDGVPQVVPQSLPYDESGILAEARGAAFHDPVEAVFSLRASVHNLALQAEKQGFTLTDAPFLKVPRETKIKASRVFAKGLTKYENLYDYACHRNAASESTAGVHISFTSPRSLYVKDTAAEYNALFDYVKVFRALDKAFAEEIKQAKRRPGFYEVKEGGRIEYRSLPANVDLDKVMSVLQGIVK